MGDDGSIEGMSDGALQQAIETAESVTSSIEHVDNLVPEPEAEADVDTTSGKIADASVRVKDVVLALKSARRRRHERGEWDP